MTSKKERDHALDWLNDLLNELTCQDDIRLETHAEAMAHLDTLKTESETCKYNCRNKRENWMQGYIECQHNAARGKRSLDAMEAWREYEKTL
jgi:hypothetical protein